MTTETAVVLFIPTPQGPRTHPALQETEATGPQATRPICPSNRCGVVCATFSFPANQGHHSWCASTGSLPGGHRAMHCRAVEERLRRRLPQLRRALVSVRGMPIGLT